MSLFRRVYADLTEDDIQSRLRNLLAKLYRYPARDYHQRDLVCTPFDGAYGRAGWVICVNGSPPQGTLLVIGKGARDPVFYAYEGRSRKLSSDQCQLVREFCSLCLEWRTPAEPYVTFHGSKPCTI